MDMLSGGQAALVTGVAGAFAVGLGGSLHCLLMCGPLACAAVPGATGAARWKGLLAYQGTRLLSYAGVGALLGGLGGGVGAALSVSTRAALPWVMAAALLASAFELGKRLRPLPGLRRLSGALIRAGAEFSPALRAGAIGAATPLLPCGLLYGLFAASLTAGSFGGGASLMGAFALGGIPALLFGQVGMAQGWRLGVWGTVLRRGVPALAAGMLIYRALVGLTPDAPRCH